MKAVYYEAPRTFSVTEVPVPSPGPDQVLIKTATCGVCKTDVHIHQGEFISEFPLIPGHEFTGVVEQVGSRVFDVVIGTRVAVDNTVLCGHCYYCRKNQPLYCENFYSLGCNGPGGFAEYVVANHDKVFPIGNLSFEEAAMIEPTACAVHGLDRIQLAPGSDVLMFGTGPTGIVLAQLLRHSGALNLVLVGSDPTKLALAGRLAQADTVLMDRSNYQRHQQAINERYPRGFDVVIDATGAISVLQDCPRYARHGGKLVIYGVTHETDVMSINPYEIFHKELSIIGSFAQTHAFDRAIQYLQRGIVQVKDLVTHRYPLDRFQEALDQVDHGQGHVKVIMDLGQLEQ
jgi:D-arabinitol dehydrogenase (NADP+)